MGDQHVWLAHHLGFYKWTPVERGDQTPRTLQPTETSQQDSEHQKRLTNAGEKL